MGYGEGDDLFLGAAKTSICGWGMGEMWFGMRDVRFRVTVMFRSKKMRDRVETRASVWGERSSP